MKKTLTFFLLLSLLAISPQLMAQRGPAASPKVTVKQVIGTTEMDLEYSRPSLAGRDVMSLVKDEANGEVWRTGANTNTIIAFNKDVTFGGETLKAGRYSLWTIPGDKEWTVIVNSLTDKWGTQYDKSGDVFRFKASVAKTSNSVETFEINMTDFDNKAKNKAKIELAWGNLSVKFPIEVTN